MSFISSGFYSNTYGDISAWTAAYHLKLNLSQTELLFIPGQDCPRRDPSVTVEDVTVLPSSVARNLGVIFDDGLSFTPNIRSCRFALYNICRIRSFLTKDSAGLLVQALVICRLDCCNSFLAAARLVYNPPELSHVTPLLLRPASDSRRWCWSLRPSM